MKVIKNSAPAVLQ